VEYEDGLRAKGITEPQHLLRLTPTVIESLIPDKPIHQRKLAALSRGRNLNAATFSTEMKNPARPPPKLGGGQAAFRSKSADDVLPEKAGIRARASVDMVIVICLANIIHLDELSPPTTICLSSLSFTPFSTYSAPFSC
jgi:hypothetical protein